MFDIGFSEVIVIAFVALIVLGPERLPKAARFVGLWVRRARAQWYSVKAELENELADEELRRSLQQARGDLEQARDELVRGGTDLKRDVELVEADITRSIGDRERRIGGAPIIEPPAPGASIATDTPTAPPEGHEGALPHDDRGSPHA
jgi:sec-independent protein translocase protein TatB